VTDGRTDRHVATAKTALAGVARVKTVVYLQLITAKCTWKTAKIMNGNITLEARCQRQSDAKVIRWYFSFIIHLKFSFISFISNHFYFYIILVLSNVSISVFISFEGNHFYIYFIRENSNKINIKMITCKTYKNWNTYIGQN